MILKLPNKKYESITIKTIGLPYKTKRDYMYIDCNIWCLNYIKKINGFDIENKKYQFPFKYTLHPMFTYLYGKNYEYDDEHNCLVLTKDATTRFGNFEYNKDSFIDLISGKIIEIFPCYNFETVDTEIEIINDKIVMINDEISYKKKILPVIKNVIPRKYECIFRWDLMDIEKHGGEDNDFGIYNKKLEDAVKIEYLTNKNHIWKVLDIGDPYINTNRGIIFEETVGW